MKAAEHSRERIQHGSAWLLASDWLVLKVWRSAFLQRSVESADGNNKSGCFLCPNQPETFSRRGLHTMRVLGNTFQLSLTPSRSSTSFQLSLRASRSMMLDGVGCALLEGQCGDQCSVAFCPLVLGRVTEHASSGNTKPTSVAQIELTRSRS